MADHHERPNKMYPMMVVIIAGINNLLLLAFARQYVANDLISLIVGVYACVSIPLCAYGMVGILKEKPKFITVFANYLFLDAAVWALCRFLIEQFFLTPMIDDEICSVYNPKWSAENFHDDIVMSVQRFQERRVGRGHSTVRNRCKVQMGALQIVVVVLLLAFAAAHGTIALGMRQHAKEIERLQQVPELNLESEKPALHDIAYQNAV